VIWSFSEDCLRVARFRSVLDPRAEDPRLWAGLVLATQAAAVAFRLCTLPAGTEVDVTVGTHTRRVQASGPTGRSTGWNYVTAVSLGLITRATDDLAVLAGVGDPVLDRSPSLADTMHYARALRALIGGDDPGPHVARALDVSTGDAHWRLRRSPQVALLDRLCTGDRTGFSRALADGLDRYGQFYSAGSNLDDPDGQMAVELLGLACLAHDRGWPVEVISDYLPRRLVEAAWLE
jgi:hypothetical protein